MFSKDSRYINKIIKSNSVIFNEISDLFIILINYHADKNVELSSNKVYYNADLMLLKMCQFLQLINIEIKEETKKNIHYHDVFLNTIIHKASIKIASNVEKGLSKIAEQDFSQNDGKIKRLITGTVKLFKGIFTQLKLILVNKSMKKNIKGEHLSFWKDALDQTQYHLSNNLFDDDGSYSYNFFLYPNFIISLQKFVDQFISEIETKAVLNIDKLTEENFIENILEVKPKSILMTSDLQKGRNKRVSFVDVIESKDIDNLDKKESILFETIDFLSSETVHNLDLRHETSEDLSLNNDLKRETTKTTKENGFNPSDSLNYTIISNLAQKIQKQR